MLAGGLGRRLEGVATGPKWLIPVNDACPASGHLQAFESVGVRRVLVVVPPAADAIEAFVAPWQRRLRLDLVANPHSADRNNWYSLLLGLDEWSRGARDDVVVVNSDLYASAAWFSDLMGAASTCGQPAALAVDITRGRSDEAMKVGLDDTGALVTAIGKVGVDVPGGEYVGLAWFSPTSALELRAVLETFVSEPKRADHWYEHGIQCHLETGGAYACVAVPSSEWVEIDDGADLEAARALHADGGHR